MTALRVEGLTKRYSTFTLDRVSFSLEEGHIMGLIGKNGAGKSTTIQSMLDLVHPDGGEIQMLGQNFRQNQTACKQRLGVVLGGVDFYPMKRLADIPAVTRRFYREWDEAAYRHYLEVFELDEGKRVNQLSAGMRVKYAIALALSHRAELLILDEPTSGLDPVARDDLLELFLVLARREARSILFSTHITSDLEKCADDITYIKNGTVLASADKDSFYRSFQHLLAPGESGPLTLEEIMVRTERRGYHDL